MSLCLMSTGDGGGYTVPSHIDFICYKVVRPNNQYLKCADEAMSDEINNNTQ